MLEARTNSADRLLYPLKKINGTFKQISWRQALDEIADKMSSLKETVGTTAVLHSHDYSNNGLLKNLDKRFFNAYGGITEVVGNLCWGAGIEAQKWDFGNAYSHAPEDIENSKAIVIWGRNVATTNMHLFSKLQEARKRGIPIAVIDPIQNATAKISNLHVSIRPGSDGFLALGIMKVIFEAGKEDCQFIENHSIGFSDIKELLNRVTLEEVSNLTTVPRETIEELAEYYTSGPASSFIGLGMQRYRNGGNTVRTIDALVAMSGNVGIPGGGANYANLGVGQSFSREELTLEHRKKKVRYFTRMNQAEQILTANDPTVKLAFITRSNALTQLPDTNLATKAFQSIDTVVVIDQFMTDTAEVADYVLPCTTVFEDEDLYYASMYHHYVNYGPKLVDAPGEAKSAHWIWTELAKRLGFGDAFEYSIDEFLKMGLANLNKRDITLEQIKERKRMLLPIDAVPWQNKAFQTPSGKYEFTSQKAEQEGKDGRIQWVFPNESKELSPERYEQFPFQLLTIHPLRSNHSQHYQLLKGLQTTSVHSLYYN